MRRFAPGRPPDESPAPPKPHGITLYVNDLEKEAKSLNRMLLHHPKNPYCEVCQVAKLTRRKAIRKTAKPDPPAEFGVLGNADYVVAQSKEDMGLTGERDALVVVDRAKPEYIDCFPLMSRHSSDAYGALREFYGDVVPKRLYTDNAPELIRACKDLRYPHDKSTPHRHQSNAFCERSVRAVVEGARSLLEQAGLATCFWPFAVRFWCFMRNTRSKDGKSAWQVRHGEPHGTHVCPSVLW